MNLCSVGALNHGRNCIYCLLEHYEALRFAQYVYLCVSCDSHSKQQAVLSLKSINLLVFIMEVYEAGTKFLNII
jgi:hypothetical protein